MLNMSSHFVMLTAIVTILIGLFCIYLILRVGGLRGKHNIVAPSVTGHPEFERGYRVQMNTLESMPILLPALWLATAYVKSITWLPLPWLPAALGVLWIVGRIMYAQGYIAEPSKRSTGFLISGIALLLLIVIAVIGIVMTWMAVSGDGTASA
ncbi:MAG: MAPEG family protein [Rhizomicrobium sp.]|jgi:glutathione S-transferase